MCGRGPWPLPAMRTLEDPGTETASAARQPARSLAGASAWRAAATGAHEQALASWALFAGWVQRRTLGRMAWEAAVVATLLTTYRFGRGLVEGAEDAARQNALWLMEVEHGLGIFFEETVQDLFAPHGTLMAFFDRYYMWVHFPVTGAFLLWVFLWHRGHYRLMRNTLAFATLAGFLIHWLWPLMPPRMFGALGFEDSAGAAIYAEDKLGPFTNQFAAMPSLHFGWALLVGVAPVYLSRHRLRWVMLAHPVLTLTAIVVTANHYFLDAVLAVPVMWFGFAVARGRHLNALLDRIWAARPSQTGGVHLVAPPEPAGRTAQRDDPAHR